MTTPRKPKRVAAWEDLHGRKFWDASKWDRVEGDKPVWLTITPRRVRRKKP